MMQTMRIKGYLTEDGEIKVDLPQDWQAGEIEVIVPVIETAHDAETGHDLSDEELADMFNFKGQTLGEILASGLVGSGADWDMGDSEEWIQEQRRKRREERQKRWTDS